MKQALTIKSSNGIDILLDDIIEFYVVRSSLLEISKDNPPMETSYHLIAKIVGKKIDFVMVDELVIKFDCDYDYLIDFIATLEDYAFN